MGGFPAEYMPLQNSMLNALKNGTLTLTLPLNPSDHAEIEQEIRIIPGLPPRGAELMASIAIRIHDNWRDTANRAITETVHDRRLPFRRFEFTTEPSIVPGAKLTPLKIGIVYCWILSRVVELPVWPGGIIAGIWDAIPGVERHALHVGTLQIQNSPLHDRVISEKMPFGAASPIDTTAINKDASFRLSNDTAHDPKPTRGQIGATTSLDTNPIERRWFECWNTAFFHALTFTAKEIVRDRWIRFGPVEPPQAEVTLHLDCRSTAGQPNRDTFYMNLKPQQGRGRRILTFSKLIPAMLEWITRVAYIEDAWRVPEYISDADQFAVLYIELVDAAPTLALDNITETA